MSTPIEEWEVWDEQGEWIAPYQVRKLPKVILDQMEKLEDRYRDIFNLEHQVLTDIGEMTVVYSDGSERTIEVERATVRTTFKVWDPETLEADHELKVWRGWWLDPDTNRWKNAIDPTVIINGQEWEWPSHAACDRWLSQSEYDLWASIERMVER